MNELYHIENEFQCLLSYPLPSKHILNIFMVKYSRMGNGHAITFLHWCSTVNTDWQIESYLVVITVLPSVYSSEEAGQNGYDLKYATDHCYFYCYSFFFVCYMVIFIGGTQALCYPGPLLQLFVIFHQNFLIKKKQVLK